MTQNFASAPSDRQIVNRVHTELSPQLNRFAPALAAVLPPHIKPEAMIRYALTACQDTPKLLECNRDSLFRAIMTAAVLGLEVDSKIGLAYILPFYSRNGYMAQFIPGYKGYITLAKNAGFVVEGNVVRAGDEVSFEYGSNAFLRHVPKDPFSSNRGEIVGAYAIAKNTEGASIFKVLSMEDIAQARESSASWKQHKKNPNTPTPWIENPAAMYMKTAIRHLAPQLPTNIQRAAAIESHHERTGNSAYIIPTTAGTQEVVLEDGTTNAYTNSNNLKISQTLGLE